MRSAIALTILLSTGCTALSPGALALADAPRRRPSVTVADAPSRPSRAPIAEAVALRRRHGATEVFDREQRLGMTTVTLGRRADLTLQSSVTVQALPDGRFRETEDVREIETSSDRATPLAERTTGARLVAVVDDRNALVSPAFSASTGSGQMLFVLRLLLDRIRVAFPDAAVGIGDRWVGPAFTVDSRPVRGWVVVHAAPQFVVSDLEWRDGVAVAVIGWHVDLQVEPFGQLGAPIEGAGIIRGTTTLELADGRSGDTELEVEIGLRPAGAPPEDEPMLTVGARYVESVRRRVTATGS